MVNNAKKNLSDYSDVFDFEIVDPNNIPFEDESFDLVIANHILFYMKDLDKVLKEIKRELVISMNALKTIYQEFVLLKVLRMKIKS